MPRLVENVGENAHLLSVHFTTIVETVGAEIVQIGIIKCERDVHVDPALSLHALDDEKCAIVRAPLCQCVPAKRAGDGDESAERSLNQQFEARLVRVREDVVDPGSVPEQGLFRFDAHLPSPYMDPAPAGESIPRPD